MREPPRGRLFSCRGVIPIRVPSDVSLREWIIQLIREGKLYRFYKTEEWLSLRADVMEDHHNECSRCAERGRLNRADTVHHEFEVKKFPHMALTRWVDEPEGRREVLHPLCNDCHNEVHGRRFVGRSPKPQLNEERWDE